MIAVESTRHHADCTVAVCVKTMLRYTRYKLHGSIHWVRVI